jgi:hypothetical protein
VGGPPAGLPVSWSLVTYDSITDGGGCCALCFKSSGCILWTLNNSGECVIYIVTGDTWNDITNLCPLGTINATVSSALAGANGVGIGPCTTVDN